VADSAPDRPIASANEPDILVRAGEFKLADFWRSVKTSLQKRQFYGLSFFSFPNMDAQEIALEVGVVREETGLRLIPNPKMRQATVRAVEALGYSLEADNSPRGHVTLRFAERPTDEDWKALEAAFLPPETNPIRL
jgi:hypothetical protein